VIRIAPLQAGSTCSDTNSKGVVKKGQDLTQPGAKDDLFEILARQHFRNVAREQAARDRRSWATQEPRHPNPRGLGATQHALMTPKGRSKP